MKFLFLLVCWSSAFVLILTPYRVEGVDGYMPRFDQAVIGYAYVALALLGHATDEEVTDG